MSIMVCYGISGVVNGTVHSGFTDPFQATACLLIVPAASRIQKSGTGDNNFVKWKGLSVGPTEMSGLVKVNHLQRFRGTQREYSSKPLNIALLNVF